MEALKAIFSRASVREFEARAVERGAIREVLRAAMSGPSCVNARDFAFLVVTNKAKLCAMAEANGEYAWPLKGAAFGVLVLGDLERAFAPAKDYWVIDASIAAQNMTIAAEALGLGSVWLGTWPQMDRVENQRRLFKIPERYVPHSVLAFGYPKHRERHERDLYEASKVHFESW